MEDRYRWKIGSDVKLVRMQPDTIIGYPNGYQKDRKSNGLRGFSSRETGMMAVPKKRTGA
jgi:hypothetical protein